MKKVNSRSLTAKQNKELAALARLPDDKIDTRAIPEIRDWSGAKRGMFYRPVKQQLTLRLDADVVAWFRDAAPKGEGYQTSINRALREHVHTKNSNPERAVRADVSKALGNLERASIGNTPMKGNKMPKANRKRG